VRKIGEAVQLRWQAPTLFPSSKDVEAMVKSQADAVLTEIASISDSQLKTKAYLTEPMKAVLRAERAGSSQLNRPLL
jgi:hypothetical protein